MPLKKEADGENLRGASSSLCLQMLISKEQFSVLIKHMSLVLDEVSKRFCFFNDRNLDLIGESL